ncbi:c-type cytochrome [Limnobacter sp. YS8-69]|uniref:C-type cytochrome n=2 Tax=Limnobacter parvus TaxID=2939690 RepID=A0ABT1XDZ1_9BURK|nr:di-heme oxidoredictase family protein [Limnobacter parvus]MCR2745506.1 c-type cytochrome [Limnobacter parvus]
MDPRTAGDVTVFVDGRNAFSFPAANLPDDERTRFAIGNSFFKRNWVQAPASTTARDGLGPHFIARSCGGCHVQDGRGKPPEILEHLNTEQPVDLLFRLSIPGKDSIHGVVPEPVYGDQLNNAAVNGVKPEGKIKIETTPVRGVYPDGTPYVLQKPTYSFTNLAYGPMHPNVMVSPRIAPQVIGLGLLEAIDEQEVLRNSQQQAARADSIKGVPNYVWDSYARKEMLGRFGWKANVASLAHQTGGAFLGDIGITSSLFPSENCTESQTDCLQAPNGSENGEPELSDRLFDEIVFYQAVLAPPARRNVNDAQVLKGQKLFESAQCAVCHRPSYTTGKVPFPALSSSALQGQKIWPYTDLLLHDMGEALADNRPDFKANGRQWKTPPLWGIGLIPDVNNHQRLLHDGRADGVEEAILWHGGEAEQSKNKFMNYSAQERAALIRFVESL